MSEEIDQQTSILEMLSITWEDETTSVAVYGATQTLEHPPGPKLE